MLRTLLEAASRLLPERRIGGPDHPLMSKYTLLSLGDRLPKLRLHRFYRGDEDRHQHNHPYTWGVSLILVGGYIEHRTDSAEERARLCEGFRHCFVRRPWAANHLHAETFHRVELFEEGGECWTLFLSGPVVRPWGFFDESLGRFVRAEDYLGDEKLNENLPPLAERELVARLLLAAAGSIGTLALAFLPVRDRAPAVNL
jgi:hypothetical protein